MNSLVWMSEEKRAEYDWLTHEQEESKTEKRQGQGEKARASSTRRARTRRNVVLVQGSALNS